MKPLSTGCALTLLALAAPAHALPLAPQYTGAYGDGDGANSRWVQMAPSWQSTIYPHDEWGDGIWGLADHAAVIGLGSGDKQVMRVLDTAVDQIDFGDQAFIDTWGEKWGTPDLAPLFKGNGNGGKSQDNWAVSFWGYIAIPTDGSYNFGVLFDDGFRFTLFGAEEEATIFKDGLNPRDRLGFDHDLLLGKGLYGFQLDAYERLEVGVVQLSWWTPGADKWTVVPTTSLYTSAPTRVTSPAVRAVPEPGTPLLLLAGLAALGFAMRKGRA